MFSITLIIESDLSIAESKTKHISIINLIEILNKVIKHFVKIKEKVKQHKQN